MEMTTWLLFGGSYAFIGIAFLLTGSITNFLRVKKWRKTVWTMVGVTLAWPIIFTEEGKMNELADLREQPRPKHWK